MSKTTKERIQSVQEQIRQLENQKKRLLQEQKEQERKARTKRLIERGAILESFVSDASALTNDQIKAFLEKTITSEYAKKALAGVTAQGGEAAQSKAAIITGDAGV
ncbi:DUF3847 domain-containing protein [Eubacteriales bacterium OttesenSCG-928-K08]|nr:DUF3847 domain-containing protein [Eubacteriales bacterium OttesenSCG-928-K08]